MNRKHLSLEPENPGSPKQRGLRLKQLRTLIHLSRGTLHKKYKINPSTLKGWEIARHGGLTVKGAEIVLSAFAQEGLQCSLGWLLQGIGEAPRVAEKMDLFSTRTVAQDKAQQQENLKIEKELAFFQKQYVTTTHLIVTDHSMLPFFAPGDYVAGIKKTKDQIAIACGKVCIVETAAGETLLRELRLGTKPHHYTLTASNLNAGATGLILTNVKLKSAAPIIWIRRKAD